METVIDSLIKNGNGISVVTVLLIGIIVFVWAIETEKLFTGPRGREMQKTIAKQAEALEKANEALHDTERDYDRLTILYELLTKQGESVWPSSTRKSEPK